jgi:hypothetical protein
MSNLANLLYKDNDFGIYLEHTDTIGVDSISVTSFSNNSVVYRNTFFTNFGINPKQLVFKGHCGTYGYYRITLQCEDIIQEIVLVILGHSCVREVYRDVKYASKSKTRLSVSAVKGGIKVLRKTK